MNNTAANVTSNFPNSNHQRQIALKFRWTKVHKIIARNILNKFSSGEYDLVMKPGANFMSQKLRGIPPGGILLLT